MESAQRGGDYKKNWEIGGCEGDFYEGVCRPNLSPQPITSVMQGITFGDPL